MLPRIAIAALALLLLASACAATKLAAIYQDGLDPDDPKAVKIACRYCKSVYDNGGNLIAADRVGWWSVDVLTDVYVSPGDITIKVYRCFALVAHRTDVVATTSFQAEAGKSYTVKFRETSDWGASSVCGNHWVIEDETGKALTLVWSHAKSW